MSNANGIGQSKAETRNNSNIRGENGHAVSDKAHSIKEVQNLRSVATQYINYVKENYSGKVAGNINKESAKAFLKAKALEVKGSTLNTYTSLMQKVSENLNKDHIGTLNRQDIQNIKQELKNDYTLSKEHINRAYDNTQAIQEQMRHTSMSLSTDLQVEAGLRANDAINSDKWHINEDNTLTISDSKGGITYTTAPISPELLNRVEEAKEMGYKVNYTEYREALKEAVQNTGQEYNGTHGLRYSFAQDRLDELRQNGYTENEAKGQVSLEMGHSRLDITDHYTSF
ncbi:hypothetical protein LCX93_04375 [Sulfurimonas sp. SWIR-19]|uniref:hypothetical protein n=1 Tax=Sulfurimonas sp. SWIR-19 TaxID=2878390 RepID=UPI001CF4599C|nr:hypothetical protein [Sulfurimonas sp. SWIR-19]UCN01155.1 hypothetical protein LCX93_04375 [Sulfurimonas sp. SWIR-19]